MPLNSKTLKLLILPSICIALMNCSNSVAIEPDNNFSKIEASSANSKYKGWDFIAEHLIKDGIPASRVESVFNDSRMPEISFIPFKLNPVESHAIYNNMTATERIDRAYSFMEKYSEELNIAEQKFGVTKYIIAAIISVETNWGKFVGNEKVFYRLARVASTPDPKNLILNHRKLNSEDSSVTFEMTKARSEYLFKTFYPHLLSLFHSYSKNPSEMLDLKGSIAGAFGLPQFLPKSYESYAVDGNKDAVVDLFSPEDAIFSVANFLKSNGWKKLLSPEEKLAVLWHYNRSEAYGRAVIRVALNLQNRFLGLN